VFGGKNIRAEQTSFREGEQMSFDELTECGNRGREMEWDGRSFIIIRATHIKERLPEVKCSRGTCRSCLPVEHIV